MWLKKEFLLFHTFHINVLCSTKEVLHFSHLTEPLVYCNLLSPDTVQVNIPSGSDHILPYIPPLVLIRIQYSNLFIKTTLSPSIILLVSFCYFLLLLGNFWYFWANTDNNMLLQVTAGNYRLLKMI